MIKQLQLIAPIQLPALVAAQLTCPASTTYRIGRAAFSNPTAAAIPVTAYLVATGGVAGVANQLIDGYVVAAGATYVSPELAGLVLPAGSTLQCFAGTAGAIVLYASGVSIQ
jgi:hypothetical protein